MQKTLTASKAALAEVILAFLSLLVWFFASGRSWANSGDALLGILVLSIYALLCVPTTAAFASIGRSISHRIARWMAILPAITTWFLLLVALESELLFVVVSLSATIGLWVGLSRRWSQRFQVKLLSVGAVTMMVAICLAAFQAIHIMHPIPTILFTYSAFVAAVAFFFSHMATHKSWQVAVAVFSGFLALLLLHEPFLPLTLVGLSPLPQHPYIESHDPVRLLLLLIGVACGIANGRHGYFHALTEVQLRRLYIIGAFGFSLGLLLGWEYSAAYGMHELTIFVGAAWLFALIFSRPAKIVA